MSDIKSRRAGSGKYQWLEIVISAPGFNYKFDTDPDEIRGGLLPQLFSVVDDALGLLGESELANEAVDLLEKILGGPSNQEDEEDACADGWLPIKDAPPCSPFVDVTDSERARDGSQELRYVRTVTENLWISALYRLTGFGYYEWETAICTREPQTCNIVRGDRRDELERLTPSEIAEWLDEHGHEKNSMETVLGILSENAQGDSQSPNKNL